MTRVADAIPQLDLKGQFQTIRDEVMAAVMQVIESQQFILGEAVHRLEEAMAAFCGTRYAIACASGTDALLLSLKTLDLGGGDEVITTPFTFFATAGAIHNAGARPVFVDIDPRTFNLDPAAVAAAITARTRGIVPVHLYGQMAAMESILACAGRAGVAVIEDAAQAVGARVRVGGQWRCAGSLGLTGAVSFFPSKNLGGWGDGGMILTSDAERAERLRRLRTHGGAKQYHHEEVGTNSRLDTLQAAVLLVKLRHLKEWNARRRAVAARYREWLEDLAGVQCPWVDPEGEHVFHQFTIRAERRDELRNYLRERGIGTAVYYPVPLHLQPCFEHLGYRRGSLPEAERAAAEVLSLPIYPELSIDQQERVVAAIREFYG